MSANAIPIPENPHCWYCDQQNCDHKHGSGASCGDCCGNHGELCNLDQRLYKWVKECMKAKNERIDTLTAENAQLHHELIEATDSCTTLRLERDTLQRRVTELEKAALAVLEDDNSESCDGDCCEPTCPYAELRSLVTTCAKEG